MCWKTCYFGFRFSFTHREARFISGEGMPMCESICVCIRLCGCAYVYTNVCVCMHLCATGCVCVCAMFAYVYQGLL